MNDRTGTIRLIADACQTLPAPRQIDLSDDIPRLTFELHGQRQAWIEHLCAEPAGGGVEGPHLSKAVLGGQVIHLFRPPTCVVCGVELVWFDRLDVGKNSEGWKTAGGAEEGWGGPDDELHEHGPEA